MWYFDCTGKTLVCKQLNSSVLQHTSMAYFIWSACTSLEVCYTGHCSGIHFKYTAKTLPSGMMLCAWNTLQYIYIYPIWNFTTCDCKLNLFYMIYISCFQKTNYLAGLGNIFMIISYQLQHIFCYFQLRASSWIQCLQVNLNFFLLEKTVWK